MLFKRRKALADLASREAQGETFWSPEFNERTRTRLVRAFASQFQRGTSEFVFSRAHALLCDDEGVATLRRQSKSIDDIAAYVSDCDSDEMASTVEALFLGVCEAVEGSYVDVYASWDDVNTIRHKVREILHADRVSWELTDDLRMEPFSSHELYMAVVQPALTLLSAQPGWENVERAYQDALGEIYDDPADAITDAGTALQEALVAVGYSGKNLGRLISNAKASGIFSGHDERLSEAIESVLEWASANRSQKGESHFVSDAVPADAWLMVHVLGALIIWLSDSH